MDLTQVGHPLMRTSNNKQLIIWQRDWASNIQLSFNTLNIWNLSEKSMSAVDYVKTQTNNQRWATRNPNDRFLRRIMIENRRHYVYLR